MLYFDFNLPAKNDTLFYILVKFGQILYQNVIFMVLTFFFGNNGQDTMYHNLWF